MGKTRAECSQNAYTSHASAFLSHWIQILANSSPKSDITKKKKKKKKKKNPTLFFRILRSVGRGQHKFFFFGLTTCGLNFEFIYVHTACNYELGPPVVESSCCKP